MKEEKIGLVVEGGGMKCAYSAGILDAFLDEGISFPYCIGVSAGSAIWPPIWRDRREEIFDFSPITSIPLSISESKAW